MPPRGICWSSRIGGIKGKLDSNATSMVMDSWFISGACTVLLKKEAFVNGGLYYGENTRKLSTTKKYVA